MDPITANMVPSTYSASQSAGLLLRPPQETCKKILVVEDQEMLRASFVQYLNRQPGWVVCGQCEDGHNVLAEIARLNPDLVLLDIQLPHKTGLEILAELRARGQETKVVIMSMQPRAALSALSIPAGANGCYAKEDGPHVLIQIVRELLRD